MKRILIYGPKDHVGGIESVVFSYVDRFPHNIISCDYIIFGDKKVSFEERIKEKGGKVFYLPNRIKHRKEYKKILNEIFVGNNYAAVWANLSGLTNIDMLKLGKRYGVPLRVVHSHVAAFSWTGRFMKYLVPLLHYKNQLILDKYATDYWACSEKARNFMFPKRIYNKTVYIKNAVDGMIFYPDEKKRAEMRSKLGIGNCLVIGHIARMCTDKNQLFLLEIFKSLTKLNDSVRLLFVGDGELKEEIYAKAEELEITDRIIFTGFKADTVDYYRASDVFCLPSLNEGLGLSIIESQACGVPCVVSDAVPHETNISGSVIYLSLEKSAVEWANEIIRSAEFKIEEPTEKLRNAEYEINIEAKKLCRFFVNGEF